jgi:single-stranded-DNA-specific exonuclease
VRWTLKSADPGKVSELAAACGISPVVARLLLVRGIHLPDEASLFLHPSLTHLHSPYKMLGMAAAVERLSAAIERKEPILIYGDYDVDGKTAVVILKTVIEICGGMADFHVPHRLLEGYGMRDEVIERAAEKGIRLIISVDTGIRAFAAAETVNRLGLDLIVTDHHLPHAQGVPKATAVLNPNQDGCGYPCKALCGAGVAFKIAQALLEKTGRERLIPSFLKMVAIATIADAVPLTGENRVFAKLGLEGLRSPVNVGLRALLGYCELDGSRPLSAGDIAFRVAPRLNAAGRMDIARNVIDLFTVRESDRARDIAAHLHQLNGDRQLEEARIVTEINSQVDESPSLREAYCMVVDGENWHRGVIGICATRVVERYCRPALVISRDRDEAHGSGRSLPGFHLLEALESCAELLTRFGGHAHAVGFALHSDRIEELRTRVDAFARQKLTPADFVPELRIDGEVGTEDITPALWRAISQLEPFGMGNPQPVFSASAVRVAAPPKILKEKHLKLRLARANGAEAGFSRSVEALAWRMAERLQTEPILLGDLLDVAFTIEQNTHPEFGGLQLSVCDYRVASKTAELATATQA